MTIIYLTVQSNYNITLENTTLQFEVLDCRSVDRESYPSSEATTRQQFVAVNNSNSIITNILGSLIGMIGGVLIVVTFFCWKRNRNQCSLQKKSKCFISLLPLLLYCFIVKKRKHTTKL